MSTRSISFKRVASVALLILFSITVSFAQKKKAAPKWLTTPLKAGEVIASGTSVESAKQAGVEALLGQFVQIDANEPCFVNMMSKYKLQFDPFQSLLKAALNSSQFKIVNKYEPTDMDSVYVMIKVLPTGFQAFNDSLYKATTEKAIDYLVHARELCDEGDFYGASFDYSKAINTVAPSLYFPMETEEGDLAEVLVKEFSTLFDGISFNFDRNEMPMIPGEDVPVEITLSALKNGKSVQRLPVKIWMRQNDAKISADNATDSKGNAKIHVTQAPKANKANLLAAVDMDQILELPENFATPLLAENLKNNLKQFSIPFVAVDATPTFYIDVDPSDSLQVNSALRALVGEKGLGYREVQKKNEADVLIKLEYTATQGIPQKAGNFKIREDKCGVTLSVVDAITSEKLLTQSIKDFSIKAPETRSAEKVRERAMREMIRPLIADAKLLISTVKYDKRKKIFNQ